MKKNKPSFIHNDDDTPEYVTLWILRILVALDCQQEFIKSHGYGDDQIARALGLSSLYEDDQWDKAINAIGEFEDDAENDFCPIKARKELRRMYLQAERDFSSEVTNKILNRNISRLSDLAGLSEVDRKILAFRICISTESVLEEVVELLGSSSSLRRLIRALSVVLDVADDDIRQSISPNGILAKSGLLTVDAGSSYSICNRMDLVSDNFAVLVSSIEDDPVRLLRETMTISTPPKISIEDYTHINDSLDILLPYLKKSSELRIKGVNVLIYGSPGTGKSQLVKVLSNLLDSDLVEVASSDSDGDSIKGTRRLSSYRAAQCFFSKRNAFIAFEEIEDIFDGGDVPFFMTGFKSTHNSSQPSKAWLNNMLETNEVPTFWISNSIDSIDPAYIRRFDFILELQVPPKRHREKIIKQSCSGMLSDKSVSQLANEDSLAPAVINRAAKVIRYIKEDMNEHDTSKSIKHIVENTLRAQGHIQTLSDNIGQLPDHFDLNYINTDINLTQIAEGLGRSKSGRICLYGPPGTGKTAYGYWLADQLGMDLMLKKASDLISPYMGMTEQNFARTFRMAARENALLMIDEVDSFLQDRRGAQRSWEVTEVNEFLTQMESFPGIFIASTNLIDNLDQAALRRFDLKSIFNFLKPDQAWALFKRQCGLMNVDVSEKSTKSRLCSLTSLTPGDFAAVLRQHRFNRFDDSMSIYQALEGECAIKGQQSTTIGFLA